MHRLILATIAAVVCVPVLGAALGALQLLYYRARVRVGKLAAEQVPFFGALLLRGMVLVFLLLAVGAILTNLAGHPASPAPAAH